MKRPRSLFALTLVATLLLTSCTRFIGTPPSTAPSLAESPTIEVALATSTAALSPATLPPKVNRATISDIVNIVEARPSAEAAFKPVQDGAVIGVGGQVRTGANSRARVDLSEGTIIRLGPDTLFTIEVLTSGQDGPAVLVSLGLGKLWASLTGGSLQVITPVGVASVRGSYAVLAYDPGDPNNPSDDTLTLDCIEGACTAQLPSGDHQAGTLERIVVTDGGEKVTRFTLTSEDVQDFIDANPEVGEALSATLTAIAGSATPGETEPTQTATATSQPAGATPTAVLGKHTVRGGESLFCIGRAYGVLPSAIAQANGLDPDAFLVPGQELSIPSLQWLNIPAGPVCAAQFDSPFPPGPSGPAFIPQITVLIPAGNPPTATSALGGTVTPTVTVTGTPVCKPPEFFDPLMNRCRIDATPLPADTSPPSISNITGVGAAAAGCTAMITADVTDSQTGVASVSVTLAGAGSPGPYGMSPVSGSTYQAVISISASDYITAANVQATDGAGNAASATKSGGVIAACSGSL